MDLDREDETPRCSVQPSLDDEHFLLNFIMGTYLGPDVKSDNPRCSAFYRLLESLTPYNLSDLGPSYVSISLLERVYYYVLRNANPSLVLKPHMFHMYLKGNLTSPSSGFTEESRQFTSLFPLNLHKQIWFPESFRIVKGIVLIEDPVTSNMKEEDLERFRSLSGIDNLKLDLNECLCYKHKYQAGNSEQKCMNNCVETVAKYSSNGNGNSSARFQQKYKRRHCYDSCPSFPQIVPVSKHQSKGGDFGRTCKLNGPVMMPLLSIPHVEDCNSNSSIVLTGTARRGVVGPPIGAVDIGIGKSAYFFRIALPGVRKDDCQFSCEIESDGKVHLQGLTTGGRTIEKRSRVFDMKFQQICPPGPFTLSFSLPGPVDPRLFAPNFRSDGIFEAVVIKHE